MTARTPKPPAPFVEKTLTLLTPLGDVRTRRMFGGYGIYLDGLMFALIASSRLYFKTDGETRPRFEKAGSKPFSYVAAGERRVLTSYYEAPGRSAESGRALMPWAELAVIAARNVKRAKAAKAPAKKATRRPHNFVV